MQPPRTGTRPAHLIARERLTAALDAVPPGGTGLLVAPPGTGKSVLIEQWLQGRQACWIRLTGAHDDAVALARDLVKAFRTVDESLDPAIGNLALHGGSRLGPQFLDACLDEIGTGGPPVVLVLDDAHRVTNHAVVEDLSELLRRVPDRCRVIVSTRWDLPLRVARLRVEGRLVELRWDDLAFDMDEAGELLERTAGRTVTTDQVKVLLERTDGWATGLQLAALSLQKVSDVDAFVQGFAGDDRLVADYLTEEVLRTVEPDLRSFLLRTSVLETLSPGLCDAVTAGSNAREMLTDLVDRGFFTTAVGGRRDAFRYHHLFADLLRFELRAEGADVEIDCRCRAAEWLLAHGQHRAGFEQLLAAGDHRAAFDIIAAEGHRLFERGETATLARGLTLIHDSDPSPTAVMGINLLASQVGADQFIAAAETYRALNRRDDLTAGERIAADTLATVLGHGDMPEAEMKRLAHGVLDALPHVRPDAVVDFLGVGGADSCETMAAFAAGLADFFDGNVVRSVAVFERVLELRGAAYPLWRVNALGALALTRAWLGQLAEAEACAVAALDAAREVGAMDHVACTLAHLAHGIVGLDRLDLGLAGVHLSAAGAIVDRCHRPAYHLLLQFVRARHRAAAAGADAALDLLRGSAMVGPSRPVVARARAALEVQLLVRAGAVAEARAIMEAGSPGVPAARFDVLVADDDLHGAAEVLDAWRPEEANRRDRLEHDLRLAALQHLTGHPGAAGTTLADAASRAEAAEMLAPFLDVPLALHILRTSMPARPLRRISALLATSSATGSRTEVNQALIEPLTPREIAVLAYLPTRLSNGEIAETLFISVNTLKTHLRNIYRKLGATDRSEGIDRASAIGLL